MVVSLFFNIVLHNIGTGKLKGHDGIYEVALDGELVYTNQSQCSSGFPDPEEIIERLAKVIGIKPKREEKTRSSLEETSAPACPLPKMESEDSIPNKSQVNFGKAGCGCSPGSSKTTFLQNSQSFC